MCSELKHVHPHIRFTAGRQRGVPVIFELIVKTKDLGTLFKSDDLSEKRHVSLLIVHRLHLALALLILPE